MHGSENPVEEGVSGLAVPVKRAKKKNKVAGGVMEMNGVAERGRTGDLVWHYYHIRPDGTYPWCPLLYFHSLLLWCWRCHSHQTLQDRRQKQHAKKVLHENVTTPETTILFGIGQRSIQTCRNNSRRICWRFRQNCSQLWKLLFPFAFQVISIGSLALFFFAFVDCLLHLSIYLPHRHTLSRPSSTCFPLC